VVFDSSPDLDPPVKRDVTYVLDRPTARGSRILLATRWFLENNPFSEFVVYLDDDSFLSIPRLIPHLLQLTEKEATMLVMGYLMSTPLDVTVSGIDICDICKPCSKCLDDQSLRDVCAQFNLALGPCLHYISTCQIYGAEVIEQCVAEALSESQRIVDYFGSRWTPTWPLGMGWVLGSEVTRFIARNAGVLKSRGAADVQIGYWLAGLEDVHWVDMSDGRFHDFPRRHSMFTRGCSNEQTRVFNEAEQQLARLREALLAVRHDATPAALTTLATTAKDSSAASLLGKRHQHYHARLSQLSRSLSEFQALAEGEVTKAIRQHVMPKSPETPEQQADFARYMRKLVAVHLLQTGSFDAFEAFIEEVGLLDGITDLVPEHYLRAYREAERVKAEGELEEAMEWLRKNRTAGRATAMRREIFDNTQRDLLLQKVYEMIGSGVESAEILELVFGGLFARQRDPSAEQRKKLQSCLLALAYPAAKREAHLATAAGLGNNALDRFWTLFFRGTWPVGEGHTKLL
ncbi:hypothetical protein FOZ63_034157, partial [Perkinsus olseni]